MRAFSSRTSSELMAIWMKLVNFLCYNSTNACTVPFGHTTECNIQPVFVRLSAKRTPAQIVSSTSENIRRFFFFVASRIYSKPKVRCALFRPKIWAGAHVHTPSICPFLQTVRPENRNRNTSACTLLRKQNVLNTCAKYEFQTSPRIWRFAPLRTIGVWIQYYMLKPERKKTLVSPKIGYFPHMSHSAHAVFQGGQGIDGQKHPLLSSAQGPICPK